MQFDGATTLSSLDNESCQLLRLLDFPSRGSVEHELPKFIQRFVVLLAGLSSDPISETTTYE